MSSKEIIQTLYEVPPPSSSTVVALDKPKNNEVFVSTLMQPEVFPYLPLLLSSATYSFSSSWSMICYIGSIIVLTTWLISLWE